MPTRERLGGYVKTTAVLVSPGYIMGLKMTLNGLTWEGARPGRGGEVRCDFDTVPR